MKAQHGALWVAALVIPGGGLAGLAYYLWRRKVARDFATTLQAIMPNADADDVADYARPLLEAMERYEINTPARRAAFLAQCAEESDSLWRLRDHFKTERGEEYAPGDAYEGRADLGNSEDGDGRRFKGRGLLQITGRANYAAVSAALGPDFVAAPELLNEPKWAALAAGWYWQSHGCNELADVGDFKKITRAINGGLNGLDARLAFLSRATAAEA